MGPRTTGALALYPMGNAQGGYYFFSLSTGHVLKRDRWTELPMPNEVIQQVHCLAHQANAARGPLAFYNCMGLPLDAAHDANLDADADDDDDESYRPDDDAPDDDDSDYDSDDDTANEDNDDDVPDEIPGVDPAVFPEVPGVDLDVPDALPGVDPAVFPGVDLANLEVDPAMEPPNPDLHPAIEPAFPGVDPAMEPAFPGMEPAMEPAIPGVDPAMEPVIPEVDPAMELAVPGVDPAMEPANPGVDPEPNVEEEMDAAYGPRTGTYNLRPRRAPNFEHLFTQHSVNKGLKFFGDAGVAAVSKELQQLHDLKVIIPVDAKKSHHRGKAFCSSVPNVSQGETLWEN
jgi:hypothetical protein